MMRKIGVKAQRASKSIGQYLTAERVIIGGTILASVFIVAVVLLINENNQPKVTSGLPTPIGFPETAQDVGTLVGQSAPIFTLPDETGQTVTVNFEQADRPTVLFFNMGYV